MKLRKHIGLIAGCTAFFAAGAAAGWRAGAPTPRTQAHVVAPPSGKPTTRPGAQSAPVSRRLAQHRREQDETHRWQTLPVEKFPSALEDMAADFVGISRIHQLLQVWAQRDPVGYQAYVLRHGNVLAFELASSRMLLADPLVEHLIPRSPVAAVELIGSLWGGLWGGRDIDLWSYAELWKRQAPESFPHLIEALGDRLAQKGPGGGWWTPHDPISLLPFFEQLPPGPALRDMAADGVVHYLETPEAVVSQADAWWRQIPPDIQESVVESVAERGLSGVDPARVQAVAAALGVPEDRLSIGPAKRETDW